MENESKYKRKAYQYTLSSIMLNNVKHECNEVKDWELKQIANAAASLQDPNGANTNNANTNGAVPNTNGAVEKAPIKIIIEETVATVANKVSGLMTPKKKGLVISEAKEEKETEEKTDEKNESKAN